MNENVYMISEANTAVNTNWLALIVIDLTMFCRLASKFYITRLYHHVEHQQRIEEEYVVCICVNGHQCVQPQNSELDQAAHHKDALEEVVHRRVVYGLALQLVAFSEELNLFIEADIDVSFL
jgi:hypothetical protein